MKFIQKVLTNKKALIGLIILDLWLLGNSVWADYEQVMHTPFPLNIFAPTCILFLAMLILWYVLLIYKKNIPFLTTATYVGIGAYGIMGVLYYLTRLFTETKTVVILLTLAFVMLYSWQWILVKTKIQKIKTWQIILIAGFFATKAVTDGYLGTFEDNFGAGVLRLRSVLTIILIISVLVLSYKNQTVRRMK